MQQSLFSSSIRANVRAPARARATTVVRASADDSSRRAVLGGFLAGVAALTASSAQALTAVDLFDDRKVKQTGFDIIYEARDESLPLSTRDGLDQARASIEDTKKRVKESQRRIDAALEPSLKKAYWTEAREELRRQVGTLRFDLNTLANAKADKSSKKQALALRQSFLQNVEALDLAIRDKDSGRAFKALSSTSTSLGDVLAYVM